VTRSDSAFFEYFNPANGSIQTTANFYSPTGIAVSSEGLIFMAHPSDDVVTFFNTNTNLIAGFGSAGEAPVALAVSEAGVNKGNVYVANSGDGTVSVLTKANGWNSAATISLPGTTTPAGIAVSNAPATAGTIYVADSANNALWVINPNHSIAGSIPVGLQPSGVAVGPDGTVYVTNLGSDTVSVINPVTRTVTATVAVSDVSGGIVVGSNGAIYVTNGAYDRLSVIV
ncbi:NHL repeat-containing protein, partial [Mycobacterium intermedium]